MKKIMFNDKYGLTEAVLSGRKTQTRRIAYDFPEYAGNKVDKYIVFGYNSITYMDGKVQVFDELNKSKYQVGEVVAIAQRYSDIYDKRNCVNLYDDEIPKQSGWNNKLFVRADLMPHHIRITDVRGERLQDISDEDCIREGIYPYYYDETKKECGFTPDGFSFDGIDCHYPSPCEAYASLIDRISSKGTWDSNPYVFVYEFELVD